MNSSTGQALLFLLRQGAHLLKVCQLQSITRRITQLASWQRTAVLRLQTYVCWFTVAHLFKVCQLQSITRRITQLAS
jgi:hypothetical protein